MDNVDYKQIVEEGRKYLARELNYGKLTAVEKLSVLLSGVAFVAVLVVIGGFALFYLMTAATYVLSQWMAPWVANTIIVLALLLLVLLVMAFKRQLIVDPITRYVTRLLLNPKEDE